MKLYRKEQWSGGSENAGMSSEKRGENPLRRKPKVSWARLVRSGLVGPKPRPKGVVDGQQVDIPVPPIHRLNNGGTQEDSDACGWKCMCKFETV